MLGPLTMAENTKEAHNTHAGLDSAARHMRSKQRLARGGKSTPKQGSRSLGQGVR